MAQSLRDDSDNKKSEINQTTVDLHWKRKTRPEGGNDDEG